VKVSVNLICMICDDVLEDPQECCHCQINYCAECIHSWQVRENTCPGCRQTVKLQRAHRYVRNELDQLMIFCANKEKGCEKTVMLEVLAVHENKECGFRTVECEHCEEKICFKDGEKHRLNCRKLTFKCEFCGGKVREIDRNQHCCLAYLGLEIKKIGEISKECEDKIWEMRRFYDESEEHFGEECKKCRISPIKGTRFLCSVCANYSVCERCKNENSHEHSDFFSVPRHVEHRDFICNGCENVHIVGVKYSCLVCKDFGR
jgi:hypothetical protein